MVSKVPSALLQIEPNQDSTDLRRDQHLCSKTACIIPTIFVQGGCRGLKEKIPLPTCTIILSFSLIYHPSWAQWKATTISSAYNRTGEYVWQKTGDHVLVFFLSYKSFLWSRWSPASLLHAEQHSTIYCIYKTSNSSNFRALGFCCL